MTRACLRLAPVLALALILCAVPTFTGCAGSAPATATTPTAPVSFDKQAYEALRTIKAGLQEATKQFGTNPAAKVPLNTAIKAYNLAEASWQLYHAAKAGAPTQAELQKQIDAAKTALAAVKGTP